MKLPSPDSLIFYIAAIGMVGWLLWSAADARDRAEIYEKALTACMRGDILKFNKEFISCGKATWIEELPNGLKT